MHNAGPSVSDVRMHGFRRRSEVPAVLDWIDRHAARLEDESVSMEDAAGRTLAAECRAAQRAGIRSGGHGRLCAPGRGDRRRERIQSTRFTVVGQAMPGQPFVGTVQPVAAVRIMTGAPVPDGVDAVVPAEYASENRGRS